MKYNWDKSEILHKLNAYNKSFESGNQKHKKEVEFYEQMLEYCFYPTLTEIAFSKKRDKKDAFKSDYDFLYSSEVEAFSLFIREFYEQVKELTINVPRLSHINFSDEDILKMNRQFFWEQGNNVYCKFIDIFWNRKKNFRFYSSCVFRPRNVSFVSPIAGNVFLAASRRKNISDLFTTINCYARAISTKMNLDKSPSKRILTEVGPIFWELVSINFLPKKIGYEDEIKKFQLDHFKSMQQSIEFVRFKEKELNTVSPNKYSTPTLLNQALPRTISYLIALELYYIYLEDQKLAFELLDKIMLLDQDSALTYLEQIINLGITPLKSLDKEIMALELKRKP